MNKPYYTCALAAAYMAREFELCLGFDFDENEYLDFDILLHLERGYISYGYTRGQQIFIHPDSFHIFKPQAGDIATDTADGGISLHISGDKKQLYSYTLGCDPMKIEQHEIKDLVIILRNKKPFFWPEGM